MIDGIPEPEQVYLQLRTRIVHLDPNELGLSPSTSAPRVWGVVMEIGYQVGLATLVCFADGTTSLYYSTGGGMLGSAEYGPVSEASKALVSQAENYLVHFSSKNEFPLPTVGQVSFIVLTYSGLLTGEASEESLASGKHLLAPLFLKAHETLEQLRLLREKKQAINL
jgi:hypothetical protein